MTYVLLQEGYATPLRVNLSPEGKVTKFVSTLSVNLSPRHYVDITLTTVPRSPAHLNFNNSLIFL
jgi:hypothetical protein